jgi:hypothetical protein
MRHHRGAGLPSPVMMLTTPGGRPMALQQSAKQQAR